LRSLFAEDRLGKCDHTKHVKRVFSLDKEFPIYIDDDGRYVYDLEKYLALNLDRDAEAKLNYVAFAVLNRKGGNSLSCLASGCKCMFIFLKRLAPHFQEIRFLLYYLTVIRLADEVLSRVDEALWNADIDALRCTLTWVGQLQGQTERRS